MEKKEWLNQLKNPRNPYDRDLVALRDAVTYILGVIESKYPDIDPVVNSSIKPLDVSSDFRDYQLTEERKKRGRPKKESLDA